jgi:uncharacterized protein YdaU (DUF1376 family)
MPIRRYLAPSRRSHMRVGARDAWNRAITMVEETRHDQRTIAALVQELKRARDAHLDQIWTHHYTDLGNVELGEEFDATIEKATTEADAEIRSRRRDDAASRDRQMSQSNAAAVRVGGAGLVVVLSAEAVRTATAERGWSLSELARRARISRPTLASALRGQPIWARTAWKLARALEDGAPALVSQLLLRS